MRLREKTISGPLPTELADWVSVWFDLQQADQSMETALRIANDPAQTFTREALWDSAVVRYARAFTSGRREVIATAVVDELGNDAKTTHADLIDWRSKRVAHAVHDRGNTVIVRAVLSADEESVEGIRSRVQRPGPFDISADYVANAQAHVKALRDRIWETRLRDLKSRIVIELDDDMASLRTGAKYGRPGDSHGYAVTLDVDVDGYIDTWQ